MLITKGKVNIKYLFIITMIAVIAGGIIIGAFKLMHCPFWWPSIQQIQSVKDETATWETYRNEEYGFTFSLPESWKGYSVIQENWQGYKNTEQGDIVVEKGLKILIRNPQWTAGNPRQDIPIMVFTINQWNSLTQDKFHIGAAPINPSELGRNAQYVFALPARYNYAFPTGWEEVEKILGSHPLNAF